MIVTNEDDPLNGAGPKVDPEGAGSPLSPDLQAQIGRRLRAMYEGVLAEPIPDRFTRLLDQLHEAGRKGTKGEPETD